MQDNSKTPAPSTENEVVAAGQTSPGSVDYSADFTALDKLLLASIENSAAKIRGSPNASDMVAAVREFTHLNSDRKHAFYHSGFCDSVLHIAEKDQQIPGDVESRKWYLVGRMMGLLRLGPQASQDWINAHAGDMELLCNDDDSARIRMVVPAIYALLIDSGMLKNAAALIGKGLHHLKQTTRQQVEDGVLAAATKLLRDRDAANSLLLAKSLGEPDLSTNGRSGMSGSFKRRLARKQAQALQELGQTKEAERILQRLVDLGDTDEGIDALADLGLIAAGFPTLYAIMPGSTAEERQSLADALELGRKFFEEAVKRAEASDAMRARNAHLALGIIEFLTSKGDPSVTMKHLNLALAGMQNEPLSFEQGDLIPWARFLLGISTLETIDIGQLRKAVRLIHEALESDVTFPLELWSRCLLAAAVFDDKSLTVEIAQELLRLRGPEIFDLIRGSGALERSPELRVLYMDEVDFSRRPVTELANDWEFILKEALRDHQYDLATTVLDKLEGLAHEWSGYSDRFSSLLEDVERYSPAWQPSEAEEARIRLLEAQGQFDAASQLLQSRFWKQLGDKSYEAQAELGGIIEHLREIRRPPEEIAPLEAHLPSPELPEVEEVDEIGRSLAGGNPVNILFVGGDKQQAQHDQTITDKLAGDYPGITVEFEHPGWGSNWKPICDRIKNHLRKYDAIVLSRLVRTNMGRCIRNMCDEETPWFACPAQGPEFVARTMVQAARRILELRKAAPKI